MKISTLTTPGLDSGDSLEGQDMKAKKTAKKAAKKKPAKKKKK